MKSILLFGAGKSATVLIDYLKKVVGENNWKLVIADADIKQAKEKTGDNIFCNAVEVNVTNDDERKILIEEADIVISLLPPSLHILVAKDCVAIGRNLLNASYVDDSIRNLEAEIKSKELLFVCELGLDPGIDHMSAMKLFDEIKEKGGEIKSFKSHCGGLIAPESDTNPWHYKISWNPRNVVLAGSAGAVYKENNQAIQKKYAEIFDNCPSIQVDDLPKLAWYANRDSLSYIPVYHLQQSETFIRTTLRYAEFCNGWKTIIDLGLTSDNDENIIAGCKTFKEWYKVKLENFLLNHKSLDDYLHQQFSDADNQKIRNQLQFLELDADEKIPANKFSSADFLQSRIEKKLVLMPTDKDMVVMLHEIDYVLNGVKHSVKSSLVVKGDDYQRTAMAKTVGLPLGITAKLILQKKIKLKGLHIPVVKEIYEPVLTELKELGVSFKETHQ